LKSTPLRRSNIPVIILILLSAFSCRRAQPVDSETLFERYFQPYPNEIEKVQEGFAAASIRGQAFRLYDEGRFDQAKVLFEELLRESTDYDVVFYLANTQLALGDPGQARRLLSAIPAGHRYYASGQWYLALALLKSKQEEEARTVLKTIALEMKEAKELLDMMD
jgi:predicted Zn-dependent protease